MSISTRKFALLAWFAALVIAAGSAIAQEDESPADKPQEKVKSKEKAESDNDPSLDELFREGQTLVQSGEFPEAIKVLKKAVEIDENFGQGWFLLGYALHMDKQLEAALKAHRRSAELDHPFSQIAAYNIACAEALLGQPDKALQSLQKSIDMGFDDAEQIRNDSDLFSLHTSTQFARMLADVDGMEEVAKQLEEGQDLINEGDFEKAAELYRAIQKKDPDNPFVCYRLGYALHGAGQLDEAIEFHKRATKFPSTRGIANYNWGCALSLQGNKEEALEKLRAAVDNGFIRLDAYQNDPDLDNLREEDGFKELVAQVEAETKAKSKKTSASGDDDGAQPTP